MHQLNPLSLLLGLFVATCVTAPARADIIFSNIVENDTYHATSGSTLSASSLKAALFTVGSSPIQFGSVDLIIHRRGGGSGIANGGIYSVSNSNPDTLLASLGTQTVSGDAHQQISFTSSSPFTLQANTTYAFRFDGAGNASDVGGSIVWNRSNDNHAVPTVTNSAYGTFVGYRFNNSNNWISSGVYNSIRLNSVSAVPEPGSAVALSACLGGILLRRRRRAA